MIKSVLIVFVFAGLFVLARILKSRRRIAANQALLQKSVGSSCPICRGGLEGHFFFDIVAIDLGSAQEKTIEQIIARRSWIEAQALKHFVATKDARLWRAVRCHSGVAIVSVISPFDLYENDCPIGSPDLLSSAEAEGLIRLAGDGWEPL